MAYKEINELIGKTFTDVARVNRGSTYKGMYIGDGDGIVFVCETGERYALYHRPDCCEEVTIEDVCGELIDLVGTPILMAEEATNRDDPPSTRGYDESFTWTFFKLATIKGAVTIRFFGTSNGYYSESAELYKI